MKTILFAFCLALASQAFANETGAEHKTHDSHDHKHAKNCGHKPVKHGDHTDYEHDGHKHKAHNDHTDECEANKAKNG